MIGLRIRTLLGGMLLAGGLVSGSWADSAPEAFSQQRLDAFGAAMAEEVQQGRIAGIATLVYQHGEVVQRGQYGFADQMSQRMRDGSDRLHTANMR